MTPEERQDLETATKAEMQFINSAFDNATKYVNIFILAGYGSFFGLWNLTHDRLYGRQTAIWAALLVSVSVTIFVVYQVYASYFQSRALLDLAHVMSQPVESLDELHQRLQENQERQATKGATLLRIWLPTFLATVVTGFGGIGILMWAFIEALWLCPVPYRCE